MNTATAPRTVNCTQCAAPLELRGGHRVRSLTCGFCGTVLDAKDEYKVVKRFADIKRPPMPLKLGMSGKINDVEFTIIGVLQMRDNEGYQWLEYQLFSPTHGYHWLVYSQGHFVFSRRVRELPRIGNRQQSKFKAKGMTFSVYETYMASVNFVEGELTYVAKVGDTVAVREGICPPYSFSAERSAGEEEYLFGEYIAPETLYKAFGVTKPPAPPTTMHPLQPYVASEIALGISRFGRWFVIPAVLIALAIAIFGTGTTVLKQSFAAQAVTKGVRSTPFTINDSDTMMALQLKASLNNAWSWYDITVLKGDERIARLGKQLSYYHGRSGGESWSEGSKSGKAYFKLSEPGTYQLFFKGTGGVGNKTGKMQNTPVHIELNEGVLVSRYFIVLAILFLLAAIWEPFLRNRFESKRWADVLEDDDE